MVPKTRREWWEDKLSANVKRDRIAMAALEADGWNVTVVWECAVRRNLKGVVDAICDFLG